MSDPAQKTQPDILWEQMQLDDLDEVLDIERLCFRSPWTPDLFVNEFFNPRSKQRVARQKEEPHVLGYLIYWTVLDEAHLMNVAVSPDFRRQGIGEMLLRSMLEECRSSGHIHVTLEVRESNIEAISLYERFDFVAVGKRKNYYQADNEDAILMELTLS